MKRRKTKHLTLRPISRTGLAKASGGLLQLGSKKLECVVAEGNETRKCDTLVVILPIKSTLTIDLRK